MRNYSIKVETAPGVVVEFTRTAVDKRGAFIEAVGYCVDRNIQPSAIKVRPSKPVGNESE